MRSSPSISRSRVTSSGSVSISSEPGCVIAQGKPPDQRGPVLLAAREGVEQAQRGTGTEDLHDAPTEAGVLSSGQSLWIQFFFHRHCEAHCGAYTVQPAKFTAPLGFLQAEVQAGRVSVQTTTEAIG